MRKLSLRPTNRRIRILVGLLLCGLFVLQFSASIEANKQTNRARIIDGKRIGQADPNLKANIERLARTSHVKLMELCLSNYRQNFRDYRCTFTKQERIAGKLGAEQEIKVKFRSRPFSVALEWVCNAPLGDGVLYVEGKYAGNMLVHPKNALFRAIVGDTVLRQPDCDEALKTTLRPVSMFGFERSLQSLLNVYALAHRRGESRDLFAGYARLAGRDTVVLERYLPPRRDYPAKRTLVYIDLEYLVPICIEGYNWDDQLTSRYVYSDIEFNVGLTDEDFRPEKNRMSEPK